MFSFMLPLLPTPPIFTAVQCCCAEIPGAALQSHVNWSVNLPNCFYVLADICVQCCWVLNKAPSPLCFFLSLPFSKGEVEALGWYSRRAGVWFLGIGESFFSNALFWILAQKIHISSATYDALLTDDAYEIEPRGEIEVKVTAFL